MAERCLCRTVENRFGFPRLVWHVDCPEHGFFPNPYWAEMEKTPAEVARIDQVVAGVLDEIGWPPPDDLEEPLDGPTRAEEP